MIFNTQTFSERLMDLIERNEPIISEYIYNKLDFVSKVKNQRNYFAHNHTTSKQELIKKKDFGYFIQICQLIYDVNFMALIGIDDNTIKKNIGSNFFNGYYKARMPQ